MDLKESDKIVWLFSEKLGKVSTAARSARKSKSKLLPLTLPFCFGEFVLFRGKNMYSLNEGEIITSFQSLLNDFSNLTAASYLCELIDIALMEEESNRQLFMDFISCFYLLENKAVEVDILLRAFEAKLIMHTGYHFNLDNCVICKNKISVSNYINTRYLGGICSQCNKAHAVQLSYAAYNALKYLIKTPITNIFKLTLSKEVIFELQNLLTNVILECYGKKPNSLEMLNIFKGVEQYERNNTGEN